MVCWKFDRFARSVSHLLRALETFNSLGIAFVSLSEQIDTTTPAGKMVFTVLGAVAELERELIREGCGLESPTQKPRVSDWEDLVWLWTLRRLPFYAARTAHGRLSRTKWGLGKAQSGERS